MSDSDLHRTNINLYASDVEWLRNQYGWGWTERVRDVLHEYVRDTKEGIVLRQKWAQGVNMLDHFPQPKVKP